MATCIVKIQEIKSPYMGTPRGLRVVVATPNMAGHKFMSDKACPSFDKPYHVTEFGDYVNEVDMRSRLPFIARTLRRLGFDKIIAVEKDK